MIDVLISRFGLPALGFAAGVEGEASAIFGGILAHDAVFSLTHVILAVALGTFIVDQTLFSVGRLSKQSAWVHAKLQSPSSRKIFWMINHHPNALIMACRFAYGFRTIGPIAIGTSSISRLHFTIFNGMAAIVWATTFVTIGDRAGGFASNLMNRLHVGLLPLLGLVIGGLACVGAAFYLAQRAQGSSPAVLTVDSSMETMPLRHLERPRSTNSGRS